MKSKITLIIAIALVLLACKKEEDLKYVFEGRVINKLTGTNIPGAYVALSEKGFNNGVFNSNFTFVKGVTTDTQGFYRIEVSRSNASDFLLEAGKSHFFDGTIEINPDWIQNDVPYVSNISMTPEAFLKVNVFNENPFNGQDYMGYENINATFSCLCCDNELKEYIGDNIDTSFVCKLEGGYQLQYKYNVLKDSVESMFQSSVEVAPFDTTIIDINY